MLFGLFLAWRRVLHFSLPKICTFNSFSRLEWRWVHTFRCHKLCTLRNSSHSSQNSHCQMAWQGIEAAKQTIEFPAAPSFFSSKKWIKLIRKTIGNRKRDCKWGCARGINTTWENLQFESTNQEGVRSAHRTDLYFSISRFSQVVFIPRAQPHAQSFFYFQ